MKKFIIVLISLCLFFSYFIYISYYDLDITTYEIQSEKINNDINIVMIGDVHDYHCHIKDKVIDKINELNHDIILCDGDIIDDTSTSDEEMLSFLAQLADISDVYMSLGNHEVSFYEGHMDDLKRIEDIGVNLLEEEYKDITIGNTTIRLGGMYNYAFGMTEGKITKEDMNNSSTYQFLTDMTNTSLFKIMLAHRPDSFMYNDAYQWDIDLVLSAHTHGGQAILPFIGGLYAPEQGWFPKIDFGKYHRDNMTLIVTRGISSSKELLPRFNNKSEIVHITLKNLHE